MVLTCAAAAVGLWAMPMMCRMLPDCVDSFNACVTWLQGMCCPAAVHVSALALMHGRRLTASAIAPGPALCPTAPAHFRLPAYLLTWSIYIPLCKAMSCHDSQQSLLLFVSYTPSPLLPPSLPRYVHLTARMTVQTELVCAA